jgi:hypothetical protein
MSGSVYLFSGPECNILSSQVLALASTGLRTGLVVDIGWHDTRVLPVPLSTRVTY